MEPHQPVDFAGWPSYKLRWVNNLTGECSSASAAHSAVATQSALAWNSTHYLLAWAARRHGETAFDIHYGGLSSSGNLLGPADGRAEYRITESDLADRATAIASLGDNRLSAFSRAAEDGERIYLRFDQPQPRRAARR